MAAIDLFTPLKMGTMNLSGRYLRSGTSESGSEPTGEPHDVLKKLYIDLANGGTPLILTGFAYVRQDGRSGLNQNAIHLDTLIPAWSEITEAVHQAEPSAKIAMQVVHGGRQCRPESVALPIAPSAVPDAKNGITPREMSEAEIVDTIEAFGQAARRVKTAGFDAVQIHTAHGYLHAQFCSPHTNRRNDAWGGTPEKRMRFLRETLQRMRAEVGEDYPILVKINCDDCMPGGLGPEGYADICSALIEDGIDGIELSAWIAEADPARQPSRPVDPAPEDEGYYLQPSREILRRIGPREVPIGVCGGWRSVQRMNQVIRSEGFDFLTASRPFIAEPDLFSKLRAGQPRVACDSCNECIQVERDPTVYCPPARESRLKLNT